MWILLQSLAVFERDADSPTSSDESSEESDIETTDTRDSDVDCVHSAEHEDNSSQQTTHSCQLPRIKMPKTTSKRRSQPYIEVVHSPDNSNVPGLSSEQLH